MKALAMIKMETGLRRHVKILFLLIRFILTRTQGQYLHESSDVASSADNRWLPSLLKRLNVEAGVGTRGAGL